MGLGKLPFSAAWYASSYLFNGDLSGFGKYSNNLKVIMEIVAIKSVMTMDKRRFRFLNFKSVAHVLRNVKSSYPKATSQLPGYNTQFDDNSYWLVKQPDLKEDDTVFIYCHGGGFFSQLGPNQVSGLIESYLLLPPEKRAKCSILILDYGLTCDGHTMPTQMTQLYETYYKVLDLHRNVGLIGDSAGGNLAICLTQHLKEKNAPKEDYPLKLMVVSPWLNLYPDEETIPETSSLRTCSSEDIIPFPASSEIEKQMLFGDIDRKKLSVSPMSKLPALESDWSDIPTFNDPERKIFMICGESETLRDECLWWAKYALGIDWFGHTYSDEELGPEFYSYETENTSVFVEPQGYHISIFLFEKNLLKKIENNTITSAEQLTDERNYCLKRFTQFLQQAL
ncbi:hypothetical protein FT663_01064 [Candidozyma haemuli var. vulneris]|uniref:Alpha/beta hydrolase fold-3 domain-containing protein n=1 Tax=Candidozyma haemuli TaxID=45357 RepID=A0A2V1AU10_9ASCO|nr:hypothetical protein CXQ85_000267 [[Candida] haemuloni]KAF3990286.1 hypothetical protein FT662_02380 [[Candida] haemuloni var. vulneris]KAF3994834.1 hypothetical protein FT663_01064 [[Candida] haemuloni var. vulneris]PVH21295.1 hypothetical protein CXQ85_000267 [[Candida] haemuloni]